MLSSSAKVTTPATLAPPASTPTCRLDGWYTQPNGQGTKWNFSTNTVSSNIKLCAYWILSTHTITYDSNGGSAISSAAVNHGAFATQPGNPTRTGYNFLGWHTDKTAGTKWVFTTK